MQSDRALAGALAAITAAVVGVVANLAIWFGLRVLFTRHEPFALGPISVALPIPSSLDSAAAALAVLAAVSWVLAALAALG